jgi:hypothetical protein
MLLDDLHEVHIGKTNINLNQNTDLPLLTRRPDRRARVPQVPGCGDKRVARRKQSTRIS